MQLLTKVRAAVVDDAAAFSRISAATFALACPPSTPAADLHAYIAAELSADRFAEQIGSSSRRLYAAVVGDDVVGYLMLCSEAAPQEIGTRKPMELRRLYVMPRYHGAGVAAVVMAEAIGEAGALARDALWLSVSAENARAIAFYRKHGFKVVGEQAFKVGSDVHRDLLMSRRL